MIQPYKRERERERERKRERERERERKREREREINVLTDVDTRAIAQKGCTDTVRESICT